MESTNSTRNTVNALLSIRQSAEKQIAEINKLLGTLTQTIHVTFHPNAICDISVKTKDAWPTNFSIDKKWTNDIQDIISIIFENPYTWTDMYTYMYTNKKPANMITDRLILSLIKDFYSRCTDVFERNRLRDLAKIVYDKNKVLHMLYDTETNIESLKCVGIEDLEVFEKYMSVGNTQKIGQEIIQAINVIIFMMKHKQDHAWLFEKLQDLVRIFIDTDENKILVTID